VTVQALSFEGAEHAIPEVWRLGPHWFLCSIHPTRWPGDHLQSRAPAPCPQEKQKRDEATAVAASTARPRAHAPHTLPTWPRPTLQIMFQQLARTSPITLQHLLAAAAAAEGSSGGGAAADGQGAPMQAEHQQQQQQIDCSAPLTQDVEM